MSYCAIQNTHGAMKQVNDIVARFTGCDDQPTRDDIMSNDEREALLNLVDEATTFLEMIANATGRGDEFEADLGGDDLTDYVNTTNDGIREIDPIN